MLILYIQKPIITNIYNQISETDIINHFNKYYSNINEVLSYEVESSVYDNYYDYIGCYEVIVFYELESESHQAVILDRLY